MKFINLPEHKKQEQFLSLLQHGTVMLMIDARHKKVVVPKHLKNDPSLKLNFDYNFNISDFRILPDRLEASLSFSGTPFFCILPMESIYAMLHHELGIGALFNKSVPQELISLILAQQNQQQPVTEITENTSFKSPKEHSNTEEAPQKPLKKKHLRLVK